MEAIVICGIFAALCGVLVLVLQDSYTIREEYLRRIIRKELARRDKEGR